MTSMTRILPHSPPIGTPLITRPGMRTRAAASMQEDNTDTIMTAVEKMATDTVTMTVHDDHDNFPSGDDNVDGNDHN